MKAGDAFGQKSASLTNKMSDWFVLPDLKIGLEYEYEGVKGFTYGLNYGPFVAKEDGSLRNNGVEFVLSQPLFGLDLQHAIEYMADLSFAHKFVVSPRCSVHVHVDVRELEIEQLSTFLLLYAVFEDVFYQIAGEERRDSNFCIPWYRASAETGNYLFFMAAESKEQNIAKYKRLQRYSGLNLASLPKYGSVEFRQLGGTLQCLQVKFWLNVIMNLYKAALDTKEQGYEVLLRLSSDGLSASYNRIFPYMDTKYFRREWAEEGVLVAQDLLSRSGYLKFKPKWK